MVAMRCCLSSGVCCCLLFGVIRWSSCVGCCMLSVVCGRLSAVGGFACVAACCLFFAVSRVLRVV